MCKQTGSELLRTLCLAFGPSGNEDPVARLILENIEGSYDELIPNRTLGVIAVIRGGAGHKRIMFSSHMDEVGFMIKAINEDGTLKVASMCGPDTRIMAGRRVTVGRDDRLVRGVFAVKPIHLLK
ncbi:MAG: M42 family peptidase, partial [Clostridia bacterium]|nr:M42 family peptidase [Clostridia bacterium]